MTFTTTPLMDNRVLVTGTDIHGTSGKTVVDGSQWTELNARTDVDRAQQAFESAVEEFFAPLTKAAEAAEKAIKTPSDSVSYVVIEEGSPGQAPTPRQVLSLSKDSIILRLIEEGGTGTDRLVWIGDELEVTAALATAPVASGAAVIGDENMPAAG